MEGQIKFHRIYPLTSLVTTISKAFSRTASTHRLHPALPGAQSPAFHSIRYIVELDFQQLRSSAGILSGKRHTEADILAVRDCSSPLVPIACQADRSSKSSEVEVSTCSMAVTPAVFAGRSHAAVPEKSRLPPL
ncbi:MAG: hypothetical protein ACLSB9_30350 [Hydrogeniiclostridium mannosilyticum]